MSKTERMTAGGVFRRNGSDELTTEAIEDFNVRWDAFEVLAGERVLEIVNRAHRERPKQRRDIVTAWLAWRLGYSRLLRRKESLLSEPLWNLLGAGPYEKLGLTGQRALHIVAQTTAGPYRTTLEPKAALAAIALWRNSGTPALRDEAERLLTEHALPDERGWQWRLVRAFRETRPTVETGRELVDLAELQLNAGYWEVPVWLGALHLTDVYGAWGLRLSEERLTEACDRAAERYWRREARWMVTMAEAAMGGRLRFAWLEKPVAASLRVLGADGARYERVAEYHDMKPYEVDTERLGELYGYLLERCAGWKRESDWARARLYDEIARTAEGNPHRARDLAELMVMERHPLRFGSRERRLRHALRQIESKDALEPLDAMLARLYVATYDIEPHALRLVHKIADRIDWSGHRVADPSKLELYLKVSDYDRGFRHLTCEVDGATLQLADKDAAARVMYFVERRFDPSRLTRSLHHLFEPVEWLGSSLLPGDPLHEFAQQGLAFFQQRVGQEDLREYVVDAYIEAGVPVSDFADVAEVGTDFIEDMLAAPRERRVLLAGVSGAVAGGFAGLDGKVVGVSDVPTKLALTAEICSRFCWYYGFDPREHPELPVEILAVALEGPRPPGFVSEDGLRHGLAEYSLQTSILVEALGTRSLGRVAARAIAGMAEQFGDDAVDAFIAEALKRWLCNQLDRRGAAGRRWWHHVIAGAAGAALDAALIYDVCESAQAVLTDRFLDRKYEGWERRVGMRAKG